MLGGRFGRGTLVLLGLLVAGWLGGLAIQVTTRVRTGSVDVLPAQLLLAVLLCLGAGAVARLAGRAGHTWKWGGLAGIAMLGSIVLGYVVLTALMWDPFWSEQESGETWFSLLIEAPFWIGVPLVAGAGFGALGWVAADRLAGSS